MTVTHSSGLRLSSICNGEFWFNINYHQHILVYPALDYTALFNSMSNSSLSSFFSASPGTRDSTTSFSSSVDFSGSSASDTVRNSATMTATPSLGSMSEIFLISSTASNVSNLLSVSLSLNTIGSRQSRASIIAIPPCPTRTGIARIQTLVDLENSPFVRRRKFTTILPDEHEPKPVITTPTPARLRSLMKEKLYIDAWIVSVIPSN